MWRFWLGPLTLKVDFRIINFLNVFTVYLCFDPFNCINFFKWFKPLYLAVRYDLICGVGMEFAFIDHIKEGLDNKYNKVGPGRLFDVWVVFLPWHGNQHSELNVCHLLVIFHHVRLLVLTRLIQPVNSVFLS